MKHWIAEITAALFFTSIGVTLTIFAYPLGLIYFGVLFGRGYYYILSTRSRGLFRDFLFLFTWPIYEWVEKND